MRFDFAVVLVFLFSAVGFAFTQIFIGRFIKPKIANEAKSDIYECGEEPVGQAWMNFNPRFYVIALVFVIFEVEIALTLPVAMVLRDWIHADGAGGRSGWVALLEIGIFIAILFSGLIWLWARKDLDWVKRMERKDGAVTLGRGAAR